ncbi:MAG: Protein translocase subunit SecA [Mycoplasmataceae bacterium]|nr:MAG: Protein translocase subunit SecA [Mycoplasmataceae bacterium]
MFHYLWEKTTLKSYAFLREEITNYCEKIKSFSDEDLKLEINSIREKIKKDKEKYGVDKTTNKFLVPVYGLVKEVIFRKMGLSLFPTQIFGGIALHNGNIAQMNTGEGKTLTALLPVCLNALTGNSVFVVTVNEYLANRDWEIAKPIFDFFEIPSSVNLNKYTRDEKKSFYENCNIIYTTSGELGFDYLKNNLIKSYKDKIDMKFDYVLIDEIDSILIDEAQNPLIISQNLKKDAEENTELEQKKYLEAIKIVNKLEKGKDYEVEEKDKNIWLTEKGVKKVENFYQIENLFDFSNQEKNFLVFNSLKAINFYKKGVEYIIDREKNKIVIIDALTGRLVPQRVYSSGIHQSIETKEGLNISARGKSVAMITYQNFFRLFGKISGMTGTAKGEADEFRQVYGMEVIEIKPYKKSIRKDWNDQIFLNQRKKYESIIKIIKENSQNARRPVLIGSPSLESSEYLSKLLKLLKIKHFKLNAVNHREEAKIIAQAGQVGSITIATNMAGRGTDIILSEESIKKGGMLLIGLGRNLSRRLDNQLQGRAGRQGNPGDTQFYISFEDELLKNFKLKERIDSMLGSESATEIFEKPIAGRFFDILISEPQESIRNMSSSYRQYTLNYDLLINKQRQMIYEYREKILVCDDVFESILGVKLHEQIIDFLIPHQQNIKKLLTDEVDIFWANYLESLNKIRSMLSIKIYLPQSPQEAFFLESNKLFQNSYVKLQKDIEKILNDFLE